jgi:antitoxin ParD1/3/4
MPTRNINLTDYFVTFIERRIASGRYGNASEVVREALRLLEKQEKEREQKLKLLRKAVKEGLDSIDQGQGIVIESERDLENFFDEIEKEVAAKRAGGKA